MRRSLIHLILGCALLWLTARASGASALMEDFDAANKLYAQGKFSEAVAAYETLLQSGSASPAIYFNLGNAFFKSGETGRAIAAYRRAEWLAPRDPDIRANLQFVRNQVSGPTLSRGRVDQWLARLTVNEWAGVAAVAFWTWLLLAMATQFRPALKPALRGVLWSAGAAALAFGLCLGASLSAVTADEAVVISADAVVRNGPLDESPVTFTAHDGAELRVLDEKNDWLEVSAANRIGWLKREQAVLLRK